MHQHKKDLRGPKIFFFFENLRKCLFTISLMQWGTKTSNVSYLYSKVGEMCTTNDVFVILFQVTFPILQRSFVD